MLKLIPIVSLSIRILKLQMQLVLYCLGKRGCIILTELQYESLNYNRPMIGTLSGEILACCRFKCNGLLFIFEDSLANT